MILKRKLLLLLFTLGILLISCTDYSYNPTPSPHVPKGGTLVFINDNDESGSEYYRYLDLRITGTESSMNFVVEKRMIRPQKTEDYTVYSNGLYYYTSWQRLKSGEFLIMRQGNGIISDGDTIRIHMY